MGDGGEKKKMMVVVVMVVWVMEERTIFLHFPIVR